MRRDAAGAIAATALVGLIALVAHRMALRVDLVLATPMPARTEWPAIVEIPRGSSAAAVVRRLRDEGIVRSDAWLRTWLQGSGQARRIRAGEYAFEKPMSVIEIGELLVSGRVVLHPVTVPEGLDLEETAARMAQSGLWPEDALLAAFRDPAPIAHLDPRAPDLEGYLFPDTYRFPKGEPAPAVARAMAARFARAWREAGGESARDGRTVREVATLASLVEKETALSTEHALVAGVYWNRLRRGMRLECDPTVITALKKAGLWTGGPLLIRDLSFASPWNTYVNPGLPPGPIASFGMASLAAALRPGETDALFFVATGTGGHRFAATLAEHQRNVALYRQAQADARRAQPPR